MPTIRIGFSSDFVLNNNRVGLGTTVAAGGNLDVDGTIKGNFSVTGVATLASYGGLVAQKQQVNKPSTIGFATVGVGTFKQYYETETEFTDLGGVHHGDDQYFNILSEDLVIDNGQILNITNTEMVGVTTIGDYDPHNHSSYVCAGSLEQVSVTGHFSVPNGGTNDRQLTPIEGTVRFNTDLNTLEFFNGVEWRQFTYNQGQSGRGLFGGGVDPGVIGTIQSVQISTRGNAQVFGDLSVARNNNGAFGSETRGVFGGGQDPSKYDVIDYVTIASSGDAIDFGNLLSSKSYIGGLSSSTRGILSGGYSPANDVIQYVQINTTGNALDFGDLTLARLMMNSCTASPTRGVMGGGWIPSNRSSTIDSITIASTGNAIDFGDLTQRKSACSAGSTGIRAVWAGGYFNASNHYKTIEYITIANGGNGIDFGEKTFAGAYAGAAASHTRLVTCMGFTPTLTNRMDAVEMTTGGDAIDFGDAVNAANGPGGLSDSHGGLGGF